MPIDALLVDGKRYLYFYCYDSATKQKKRVYIGPASDADSRKKALMLEGRYRSVQTVKKRILAHLSKLAIYHTLGDSGAETERLAIAEELEKMVVVVSGCPSRSQKRALLPERAWSSGKTVRTVKSSILGLVKEAPRRYSEIQRELGRPDKTIYVSLKQLIASGLIRRMPDGAYAITNRGKAALIEAELGETAAEIVTKVGPEKARAVKRCLDELLAQCGPTNSEYGSKAKIELFNRLALAFR